MNNIFLVIDNYPIGHIGSLPTREKHDGLTYSVSIYILVDTSYHALQCLARSTFYKFCGTCGNHILNTGSPTDT